MDRRKIEREKYKRDGKKVPDELKEEFSELIYFPLSQEGIRSFEQMPGEKRFYALSVLRFFHQQMKIQKLKHAIQTPFQKRKPWRVELER